MSNKEHYNLHIDISKIVTERTIRCKVCEETDSIKSPLLRYVKYQIISFTNKHKECGKTYLPKIDG